MSHILHSQVLLRGLRLFAHHGVLPQERTVGAYFMLDVAIDVDVTRAAETDDLATTISYAEAYDIIRHEMAIPSQLLEHVAGRIGRSLLHRFPTATSVHITLLKENPPMGADCLGAGVSMSVGREGDEE